MGHTPGREMFCGLSASLLPWEHEFKASKKIHWLSTETSEFPQSELPRIHRRGRPRVQPGYPHPQEHHSARYWRLKRAQLQGHSASDQRGRDHQHRVVRHRYRGCRLELHRLWRHDTRNDQWERRWAFLGRSVQHEEGSAWRRARYWTNWEELSGTAFLLGEANLEDWKKNSADSLKEKASGKLIQWVF